MKKLIIVCEEKLRKYGDFLSQLISLEDDTEDKIVGVKDGSVTAQVWTEKEYESNSAKISSEQYILFIGNSKLIKEKRSHMLQKFGDYGMHYGWLGKQAALNVSSVVDIKDYENFYEYAKANQGDVTKLIEMKRDIVELPESLEKKMGIHQIINPILQGPLDIINAPVRGINAFNQLANRKKVEEQEYTCLILSFYLNALSEFLGLSKE